MISILLFQKIVSHSSEKRVLKKRIKKYLHLLEIWCIIASAVTLIAKKREVAIAMNPTDSRWVFRGANVKRPQNIFFRRSVNLTASHCTNHSFCQRADKRVYQPPEGRHFV